MPHLLNCLHFWVKTILIFTNSNERLKNIVARLAQLYSYRQRCRWACSEMSQAKEKKAISKEVCGKCLEPEGSAKVSKLSACARCGLVLYCSRDCQKAHWKSDHKQRCNAKADRVPLQQDPLGTCIDDNASKAAAAGEKCSICLDPLADSSTLECNHVFHVACVAELRKLGVEQTCPLCRAPLPAGPEQLNEEAARRYVVALRLVAQGKATWSALPAKAQQEVDAAVAGWQAAAEQGFVEAMLHLGHVFEEGHGVAQSDVGAARWYTMAAERNDAKAQSQVGLMFKNGKGVAQSDVEAARWWKRAAEQGNANAQHNLGILYNAGTGVKQSDVEAARWWRKAAEQGIAQAQYSIGHLHDLGQGVAQSDAEAVRWYKRASDQGNADAQFDLGLFYVRGNGVA